MTTVNEINQIYCNESITVNQINMTSLLEMTKMGLYINTLLKYD